MRSDTLIINDVITGIDTCIDTIIDIKYEVSVTMFSEEQIYCFSAMIMYK